MVDWRAPLDEIDDLRGVLGEHYDVALEGRSDIEYIRAAQGEKSQDRVGDGETYERKIIDNSAENARHRIHCRADDWTVRDIAFIGTMPFHVGTENYGRISNRHVLYPGVGKGATGLIENVYAADGAADRSVAGFAFIDRYLKGTLTIRRCNIQEWVDNGVYASSHGKEGAGKVIVEQCYGKNNTTDNYRLSLNDEVIDSVSVSDDKGPGKGRAGHGKSGYTSLNRGVWVRDGNTDEGVVVVENSDFVHPWAGSSGALHSSGQRIRAVGSRFGPWRKRAAGDEELVEFADCDDNPDPSPPPGVPMNPLAAVTSAGGSAASVTGGMPELVLEARGIDGVIRYEFKGNANTVRPLADADTGDNSDRPIRGDNKAWRGLLAGGADNFGVVSDHLPHLDWIRAYGSPGDLDKLSVTLDGEPIPFERRTKRVVRADGSSGSGDYCVILNGCSLGDIAKIGRNGATVNPNDSIASVGGRTALVGSVFGGVDAYELDRGEVASVMTTDDAIDVSY